jgi:hypothetical protein
MLIMIVTGILIGALISTRMIVMISVVGPPDYCRYCERPIGVGGL